MNLNDLIKKAPPTGVAKTVASAAAPVSFSAEPISLLLVSQPGFGKSSLAFQFPKPEGVLLPRDRSALTLMDNRQLPRYPHQIAENWISVLNCLDRTLYTPSQTVVLESLQFVEAYCFAHYANLYYGGVMTDKKGWLNYNEGPRGAAKNLWPYLIDALDRILLKGKHIVFTGHTYYKTVNNPHGLDYDVEQPVVSDAIWQATHPFIQCVCHIGMQVEVEESESRSVKTKARDEYLQLQLSVSSTFKGAKNKWGISKPIRCASTAAGTWEALCREAHLSPQTGFSNRKD